jgi:hypothetical protein
MTGRRAARAPRAAGPDVSLGDAAASFPEHDGATVTGRRRGLGSAGLARVGRVVLWAFVGLVLIRGLGAIFGGGEATDRSTDAAAGERRFPDDEARAFAVRFTHTYLGGSKQEPEAYRRAVAAFLAEDLHERTATVLPETRSGARVVWATVARESALERSRALITVAVSTGDAVRYLTVPVARDHAGGLVVFDLPSLSAAPSRGAVDVPEPVALPEAQARPITDLVTRFLTAYVSGGDRAALAYLLSPGARLVQMSRGLQVVEVEQVARDRYPARRGVAVVALVRVRDRATDAELVLRYRLTVVERERWYVQVVAGGPSA